MEIFVKNEPEIHTIKIYNGTDVWGKSPEDTYDELTSLFDNFIGSYSEVEKITDEESIKLKNRDDYVDRIFGIPFSINLTRDCSQHHYIKLKNNKTLYPIHEIYNSNFFYYRKDGVSCYPLKHEIEFVAIETVDGDYIILHKMFELILYCYYANKEVKKDPCRRLIVNVDVYNEYIRSFYPELVELFEYMQETFYKVVGQLSCCEINSSSVSEHPINPDITYLENGIIKTVTLNNFNNSSFSVLYNSLIIDEDNNEITIPLNNVYSISHEDMVLTNKVYMAFYLITIGLYNKAACTFKEKCTENLIKYFGYELSK